jgi:uncharacterized protein
LRARIEGTTVPPQPLSDPEFERLHDILARFGAKRAMNLEEIDGFLAALLCGPHDVPQSEYLSEIWGDNMVNEAAFEAQPNLQDFARLIIRHRDAIAHTLSSGDVFTPLLLEDDQGVARGNDWANAFLRGMELCKEEWAPLLDDDENGGALVPIFALAREHDPDPEMRSYQEPVSGALREKLIVGIAAGVMRIFRYFREPRFMATHIASDSLPHRRVASKVGRNEPCPCGSGKKFKVCCAKVTLH